MRLGQPDMQGQNAGLGAKAEQTQEERRRCPEGRQRRLGLHAHIGKGVVAGIGLQHAETQQDGNRANMRDQDVEESGAADFRDAMIGRHQKK